jgi:hypothetical protein
MIIVTRTDGGDSLLSANFGLAPLHPHNVGKLRSYAHHYVLNVNKRAVSDLRCGLLNSPSNLLPSTYSRAKGVSEGYVLSMGVHLLSGFRVAFQEVIDREVELREQLVNIAFRSHLDHLSFRSPERAGANSAIDAARARTAKRNMSTTLRSTRHRSHRARYPSCSCAHWVNSPRIRWP